MVRSMTTQYDPTSQMRLAYIVISQRRDDKLSESASDSCELVWSKCEVANVAFKPMFAFFAESSQCLLLYANPFFVLSSSHDVITTCD
jgi:hypothetical protein